MRSRFINCCAKTCAVHAHNFAVLLNGASADHDGINVASLRCMHHGAKGIPVRVEVNIAGVNQDKVCLFAWCQAANFGLQPCTGSAIDSRGFKELRCRQRFQ